MFRLDTYEDRLLLGEVGLANRLRGHVAKHWIESRHWSLYVHKRVFVWKTTGLYRNVKGGLLGGDGCVPYVWLVLAFWRRNQAGLIAILVLFNPVL